MAEVLGSFEQAVLLAIVRLRADAYGRMIFSVVQSSLHRNVSAGAVYTTLDRLESRGLVRSRLDEGTPARGGRPRRYYSVAGAGARALNEAHETLSDLWHSVQWPVEASR
jgi:PadR family transcriptional regulator